MREIKFRAWDNVKDKMYYLGEESDVVFSFDSSGIVAKDITEASEEFKTLHHLQYMQYTGLKDKNGKEIYERDLLEDEQGIGEVEWVQEHCGYCIFTRNPSAYYRLESDGTLKVSEVIGNIYEHPELLGRQATDATE